MADHYIGLNRGKEGATLSDFVTGTSTGSTDVEVRIADAAGWTRKELVLALEAIVRLQESNGILTTSPPL